MSNLELHYNVVVTTAPEPYDYGYVVPIPNIRVADSLPIDVQERLYDEPWRTVMIPTESTQYQTDRYLSGMYYVYVLQAN
jgi:hypothetical protein